MTGEQQYEQTVAYNSDVNKYRHDYPTFDYEHRVAELASRAAEADIGGVIVPNPIDLTYFTGTGQPANLYIPVGEPAQARVFVRRAMGFAEQEIGLPDEQIVEGGLSALVEYAADHETIGLPLDVVPASLASKLKGALSAEAVDVSDMILSLRTVKDSAEISVIEHGASLYEHAHTAIREQAAPGVTEKAVAGAVANNLLAAGMDDHPFFRRWDARLPAAGLIASGDTLPLISGHAMTVTGTGTSRSMPWGPSNRPLEQGDFLVADLALNYAGYNGDVARTYVVGDPTEDQQEWFDLTRSIHDAARAAIEPGIPAEKPFLAARDIAEDEGVADWLCGYAEMQAPYIGHAIGLEVDEEPTLVLGNKTPLQEGMVLTVEPKLIHPDRGAVMIEDDYLVTEDGVERLSTVPQELFSIPTESP